MQFFIKFHCRFVSSFIKLNNTPHQNTAIVWPAVAHHFPAGPLQQISSCKITIKNLFNIGKIFFRNLVITAKITVDSPAISIDNYGYIFRTLHTAFDFIGCYTGFDQLR